MQRTAILYSDFSKEKILQCKEKQVSLAQHAILEIEWLVLRLKSDGLEEL